MYAQISRAKSGLANYLEKGIRQDSQYTRSEKDNIISLYGSLETFKQTEEYLNKEKNYKYNYLHITISYSKEDMIKMDSMSYEERIAMKKDIVMSYIKHHTSGYDLDNEVIAYAETHQPIIKYENNKERLEHEHIAIALYNPLNDTKLRTTFYNNSYIDDTLQTYINKKYGLTIPRDRQKDKTLGNESKIGKLRKEWIEQIKDIKNSDELIHYLENDLNYKENIDYKISGSKNYKYVKLIDKGINSKGEKEDVNLRGKQLEHLTVLSDNRYIYPRYKSVKELEQVLTSYYEQRIKQIDNRRSKETKEAIKEIYKEEVKDNEYSLTTATYQQKIFYKHYKHLIDKDLDLKGYYVDIPKNDNNNTKFINKAKNINIEDKGDKIVSHINDKENLQERVRLMLNVAEAKKWNINNLEINGSKEFKEEAEKQIAERIRLQEQLQKKNDKTLSYTEAVAIKQEIDKRPTTATQTYKQQAQQKQEQTKADNDISLTMLKQNLQAQRVLDYAIEKYKLNPNDYEITEDNKINNKNNKQKPKNVIDFLQKEVNIKTSEAIDITKELYKQQPLNINTQEEQREVNTMPMKLSICKDTNPNALSKWEQVEVTNYAQLASYMKQYPYSQAIYDNQYRNADNANSFNNVLIYDIDNDKDTPQLAINEAKQLLEKHNISAMILPSKSNNIDKNGYTAERYRIVIPTNKAITINDKDTYREFQKITARALKIDKYVDNKALNDRARFYYKSPISAEPTVIKSDRVMNIENLQTKAIENIAEQRRIREAEQQRAKEIKANLSQYKTVQREQSNNLTYANVDKIMQLDIRQLINHFEKQSENYKEGSYEMIKTANAKYSIIDNNVAHDFKNDKTYNSLTYLQHKIGTSNINNVARELEKITGESYMEINYPRVKEAVIKARQSATNDKSFEQSLKDYFNVKYTKLNKDSITIADKEIKLSDIKHSKQDIIKDLQSNREAEQQRQQRQQSRGYKMSR